MKYIRTLILAAILVVKSAPADPPVFSQQNNCCWLATWLQIVNNLPEIRERIKELGDTPFVDYTTFANSTIGKKLAQKKVFDIRYNPQIRKSEEIAIPALDYYKKNYFSPDAVTMTQNYLTVLKNIEQEPKNTVQLDATLEKLQRLIQKSEKKEFGKMSTPTGLTGVNGFLWHPIFNDLIFSAPVTETSWEKTVKDRLMAQFKEKNEKIPVRPILVLHIPDYHLGLSLKDSFSLDLTELIEKDSNTPNGPVIYNLIGIVAVKPTLHWWCYLKDQYDPTHPWWWCDTLHGNKQVTEQKIITKKDLIVMLFYRKQTGDKKPLCDTKTENCNQDNRDIEALARVLWELSK